jgi:hypothetical protein
MNLLFYDRNAIIFLLIFSVAMTAWNTKLRNCNVLWTNFCSKTYKKQSYCKSDPESYTWIVVLSVELPAKLFNCVGRQVMEWGEISSRQWVSITMKCMWRLHVEEQEAQGTSRWCKLAHKMCSSILFLYYWNMVLIWLFCFLI